MRIRVIQRPSAASVDGLELTRFEPGRLYDVGTALGSLMLSEGWAEPVATETPASGAGVNDGSEAHQRERSTPLFHSDIDVAADYRRRR